MSVRQGILINRSIDSRILYRLQFKYVSSTIVNFHLCRKNVQNDLGAQDRFGSSMLTLYQDLDYNIKTKLFYVCRSGASLYDIMTLTSEVK